MDSSKWRLGNCSVIGRLRFLAFMTQLIRLAVSCIYHTGGLMDHWKVDSSTWTNARWNLCIAALARMSWFLYRIGIYTLRSGTELLKTRREIHSDWSEVNWVDVKCLSKFNEILTS